MTEATRTELGRRHVLAVVGYAGALSPAIEALCVELGEKAIAARFRLVTGGLGGVMEAVSRGAREAPGWQDGDIVGILPGYDRRAANPYVDLVIPTGMQIGRNVIIAATADVMIAVGGGAGTLSEIAVAWQLGKPIIALGATGGWADRLTGEALDERRCDIVYGAATASEAIALAIDLAELRRPAPDDIGSGWKARSR